MWEWRYLAVNKCSGPAFVVPCVWSCFTTAEVKRICIQTHAFKFCPAKSQAAGSDPFTHPTGLSLHSVTWIHTLSWKRHATITTRACRCTHLYCLRSLARWRCRLFVLGTTSSRPQRMLLMGPSDTHCCAGEFRASAPGLGPHLQPDHGQGCHCD